MQNKKKKKWEQGNKTKHAEKLTNYQQTIRYFRSQISLTYKIKKVGPRDPK